MINSVNSKLFKKLKSEITDLNEIKKILLSEKQQNIRQENFENYLNTNVLNQNRKYFSKIFCDSENVIFTNGISIYIVKSKFLNTNKYKLCLSGENPKYKLINYDQAKTYLEYVKMKYGESDNPCFPFSHGNEFAAQYFYLERFYRDCYFDKKEIDMCTAILNEPTYKVSVENPILKAESEIGKAYILGRKRCQD